MVTGSHESPKLSCMFTWGYPNFLCIGWRAEVGIIGLIQLALVPMRGLGLSGLGGWWWGGVLWAVCVQGRAPDARVSRLPMIILLGGYSDTLLVVSILDIVYDCHLRPLLQSWGVINGSCKIYGSFLIRG